MKTQIVTHRQEMCVPVKVLSFSFNFFFVYKSNCDSLNINNRIHDCNTKLYEYVSVINVVIE